MDSESGTHRWKFFRTGDVDQVSLSEGSDLMHLDRLDQKLWVALACPTFGLHFDARTLRSIDTDGNGRIRAPELIAAVRWAGGLLKDPDDLVRHSAELPLDSIDAGKPEGAAILAAARQILHDLGRPEATAITAEETADTVRILSLTALNGDGIIIDESTADEGLKAAIHDVIACLGADTDRSGKPGASQAKIDAFFAEARAFDAWMRRAEADPSIRPAGEATASAAAAVREVRSKVTDYFTRCRLAAFDARAIEAVNREQKEYLQLSGAELSPLNPELAAFPLSRVEACRPLPLDEGINPAWEAAIARLRDLAVTPLLGRRGELTEEEWAKLLGLLAPWEAWQGAMGGAPVQALGIERVRALLEGDAAARLAALVEQDLAEGPKVAAIESVDRLALYCRDLHSLCVNFVNFRDFYSGERPAIFQAGTLYIDRRSCDLTLYVNDPDKQVAMAPLAGSYLLYCDCRRKGTGEKRQIVAAVTNGDGDNLMVGRNGVFYDRDGNDWDATVTRIVDNPISLRQAFWSPYKKLVRLIEEQVAKRAAAAEAASNAKMENLATGAANVDQATPAPGPKKIDVGTVAAMGVAFGALATAFAAIAGYVTGLLQLPFWQLCLALVALLVLVSGPSVIIAWLKLRRRNLGPLMDACGWALNARARINVPFGARLTGVARLPAGSSTAVESRFSQRPAAWPKLVLAVIVICFVYSLLNDYGLIDLVLSHYGVGETAAGRSGPAQP